MFAIPYERDFTLLGTTDIEINGDPDKVTIDEAEITYICDAVSEYFDKPVRPEEVVSSYSGVRPLFDDEAKNASKVTREYVLQLDDNGPPILSVFGGKITTCRKLSEQVVDMLKKPMDFDASGWTANARLPGGDIDNADFASFLDSCRRQYSWLDEEVLQDYTRNYGTDIEILLDGRSSMPDLGQHFGGKLYECEVDYLIRYEWAEMAEDILWRRTKKGLCIPEGSESRLKIWLQKQ
jgi:glycerol-3-phosphate dehydrogenase